MPRDGDRAARDHPSGAWRPRDREGVAHAERQAYYERIRGLCDDAGAAYADFSSCEYEKYFLCDTVHPGWRGWVRIEQAFYDFVHDRDDAFLGGGRFGAAEGLDAAATRARRWPGGAEARDGAGDAGDGRASAAAAARAAPEARPALLGAAAALAAAMVAGAGWFVVFSGLSEPVQFVYSSF